MFPTNVYLVPTVYQVLIPGVQDRQHPFPFYKLSVISAMQRIKVS